MITPRDVCSMIKVLGFDRRVRDVRHTTAGARAGLRDAFLRLSQPASSEAEMIARREFELLRESLVGCYQPMNVACPVIADRLSNKGLGRSGKGAEIERSRKNDEIKQHNERKKCLHDWAPLARLVLASNAATLDRAAGSKREAVHGRSKFVCRLGGRKKANSPQPGCGELLDVTDADLSGRG
jgi:hypothetical protein